MYQITYNGAVLYDPREDRAIIRDVDAHLAAGEAGSLSFTIDNDHPGAGKLKKLLGNVELCQDGVTIYRGRIIRDEKDFYNSHRVETEGLLASLNDSIIEPFVFPDDCLNDAGYQSATASGNVIAYFLGWILSKHNVQVTDDRQIKLGTVTVTDDNNYIARDSSEYLSAWEIIKSRLPGSAVGGYILPRYEKDGVYLDYLSSFDHTNTQEIEFGENLLDITSLVDASEVYTAIIPLGKDGLTIQEEADGSIGNGLIKSGKLIYSIAGRAQYGNITKVIKWDDVTVASNLITKASSELMSNGIMMSNSLTVKAYDLHLDDSAIESFQIGESVVLKSSVHNIVQSFELVELEPDIQDPGNTTITLGKIVQTQTDINQSTRTTVVKAIEKAESSASQQISTAAKEVKAEILSTLNDYVVEEQTGNGWTYRKWISGWRECWGDFSFISGEWSGTSPLYYGPSKEDILPSGLFSKKPTAFINASSGTDLTIWATLTDVTSQSIKSYFMRIGGNDSQNIRYSLYVAGK